MDFLDVVKYFSKPKHSLGENVIYQDLDGVENLTISAINFGWGKRDVLPRWLYSGFTDTRMLVSEVRESSISRLENGERVSMIDYSAWPKGRVSPGQIYPRNP
ncbi:MAG: hypothetical protein AABX11_03685 [Nanoarchaeota archaeon]